MRPTRQDLRPISASASTKLPHRIRCTGRAKMSAKSVISAVSATKCRIWNKNSSHQSLNGPHPGGLHVTGTFQLWYVAIALGKCLYAILRRRKNTNDLNPFNQIITKKKKIDMSSLRKTRTSLTEWDLTYRTESKIHHKKVWIQSHSKRQEISGQQKTQSQQPKKNCEWKTKKLQLWNLWERFWR